LVSGGASVGCTSTADSKRVACQSVERLEEHASAVDLREVLASVVGPLRETVPAEIEHRAEGASCFSVLGVYSTDRAGSLRLRYSFFSSQADALKAVATDSFLADAFALVTKYDGAVDVYPDPSYVASDLIPSTFCVDRSERPCRDSVVLALTLADCGAVLVEVDSMGGNADVAREVARTLVGALTGLPERDCTE